MKKTGTIVILILLVSKGIYSQNPRISLPEMQEKVFLSLAESLYQEGEYNRALSIYIDFVDLFPDSTFTVRALESMADLYEKQQKYPEALSVYETLYQRTGNSSSKGTYYYYSQARILNIMGEIEKAGKIYTDIMTISPDSPYAQKARINSKLNNLFN